MKKYLVLLSLLLTILSVTAMAAEVDFTISSASATIGDEVSVTFSVDSHVNINSIAFRDFVYDTDSLEFIGFEACDELSKLVQFTPTLDNSKMAVAIALKKATTHSVDLFTATFRVKETTDFGDISVSATAIAKKSSDEYETLVTPGKIRVSCITLEGTSLVLDGSIGVKTYFTTSDVVDANSLTADVVVYDDAVGENVYEGTSEVVYDSAKEMYYTVVYIAPKDVDNRHVSVTLNCSVLGKDKLYACPFESVTVSAYIEEFKMLAAKNPESEYGRALALVEKMEDYTEYADNYFGGGDILEDVITDTDAISSVKDADVTGELSDIQLYATSLVLEDKTTIRHYFTYSGDYTKHTFNVGGKEITPVKKGNLIYVDIEDIVAQDMDNVYTLTVSDKLTVNYSVLNYVKLAVSSADKRMANLVKALFNYYKEAEIYVK